ncbi:membrane protein [Mycobacterium phage Illumine]|nr:hypothetical protein SEA_DOLE_36 [Mycobacterium phage Dole]UDL14707.1 membrane protein [Mycobacterium phage Devera]UDL14973.1 membrane protein [Mycobacterium phage Illumine]
MVDLLVCADGSGLTVLGGVVFAVSVGLLGGLVGLVVELIRR